MLTKQQIALFEDRGLVKLPGAVGGQVVDAMAKSIWAELADRFAIDQHRAKSWTVTKVRPKWLRSIQQSDAWAGMASPILRSIVDQLLGRGEWIEPEHWGQILMNFPDGGSWVLPHQAWHVDLAAGRHGERTPGLQVFLFLESVLPRAGGTLAVCGSHHLVARCQDRVTEGQRGHSGDFRRSLEKSDPWFRDLCSCTGSPGERVERFMALETSCDGIPLQVEELTGEPGDMVLMHPLVFHNTSPHCGESARMMLTERLWRRDVMHELWQTFGQQQQG